MSSVSSVLSTAISSSSSTSTSSSSSLASSLSSTDFLTLLCTQLQNQNPLDPSDPDEFMSELVSYASLDQQSETNTQLSSLVDSVNSLLSANAVGYMGRTVEVEGDTTTLTDGNASWGYELASNAASVTLTVTDSDGNTVYSANGETSSGSHSFSWDGTTSSGTKLTSGDYTLTVTAADSSGDAVDVTHSVSGTVTGVDNTSGSTVLTIGNVAYDLSDIRSIAS